MDKKKLIPIIAMISVLIMLVWGFLQGTFEYSWLAVMAGGIGIVCVSILSKKDGGNNV